MRSAVPVAGLSAKGATLQEPMEILSTVFGRSVKQMSREFVILSEELAD